MVRGWMLAAALVMVGLSGAAVDGAQADEAAAEGESAVDQAVDEATEVYAAAKAYSFKKKEELMAWLDRRLADLDSEAEELSAAAREAGDAAARQWSDLEESLAEQREFAHERLEQLGEASADAWERVKTVAVDAVEDLDQALGRAADEME